MYPPSILFDIILFSAHFRLISARFSHLIRHFSSSFIPI
jgi:hypothetical protein